MSHRPFLALIRKDLRVYLSDRRAVRVSFLVPVVLASIFSSISGGGGDGGGGKVTVLVVDQDNSELSGEIIKGLGSNALMEVEETGFDRARSRVRAGKADLAVVFPPGFGKLAGKGLFGTGPKPEITILTDPTHSPEAGVARGVLMQNAMEAVSRSVFGGAGMLDALAEGEKQLDAAKSLSFPVREGIKLLFRDLRKLQAEQAEGKDGGQAPAKASGFTLSAPISIREEVMAAKGQFNSAVMAAHSFAGMAVQFVLFASVESGVGLLTERQKGLWRRFRSAPLSRWSLLTSKAVSTALIALAVLIVQFSVGVLIFNVKFSGSVGGFVFVAWCYALTASTFGLLVAAIGKTPQAARGMSVLAVLIMVLLGGAWFPSFLFPDWLQKISFVFPTRWAVEGFEGATWRGQGFAELFPKGIALLVFAVIFGLLAAARFRWDED